MVSLSFIVFVKKRDTFLLPSYDLQKKSRKPTCSQVSLLALFALSVLTVTVHPSFFPAFDFFKYVAFCTGFNLLTPIFMLPYIIMDLPIFVIAEWATLLVDICCPRGGS